MPEERKSDARRWLLQRGIPENLLESYTERYRIPESEAHTELLELGYEDHVRIQYIRAQLIRGFHEILDELLDAAQIVLLGSRSERPPAEPVASPPRPLKEAKLLLFLF